MRSQLAISSNSSTGNPADRQTSPPQGSTISPDTYRPKGLKRNSINSYLSNLRAIYNAAVAERLVPRNRENPFCGYRFKRENTPKRALPMRNLLQLAQHDTQGNPAQQQALILSLFNFLAYGMPFIDIVHLRKENLQGNTLCYQRHKTGMRQILKRYQNDTPYLFPLGQAPRGKPFTREAYKRLLSQHNQQLKQIGQALGIHQPLTSYVLRHSWASTALAHEVPVALISQAMGHTSEKTTRCYLQQLDQSTLDQANLRVIAEIEDLIIMKGNPLFRE